VSAVAQVLSPCYYLLFLKCHFQLISWCSTAIGRIGPSCSICVALASNAVVEVHINKGMNWSVGLSIRRYELHLQRSQTTIKRGLCHPAPPPSAGNQKSQPSPSTRTHPVESHRQTGGRMFIAIITNMFYTSISNKKLLFLQKIFENNHLWKFFM